VFLQRYSGTATIVDSNFESALNSIHLEEGADVNINKLILESRPRPPEPPPGSSETRNVPYRIGGRGGGFYLGNMKRISHFHDVIMTGLKAEYGGCIYVEVDPLYRDDGVFNVDTYLFTNVRMKDCMASKDGGAIFVSNIKSMLIT
jgi:hypothetical protein